MLYSILSMHLLKIIQLMYRFMGLFRIIDFKQVSF